MGPILGGKDDNWYEPHEMDLEKDMYGDQAIWNIYREYGFVSYMSLEHCNPMFPGSMGTLPKIDHLSRNFMCSALNTLPFCTMKACIEQR